MYRVMIGDDEGIVIDALKFIIQKNFGDACTVEAAKTGRSLIELAENFRPDIAFMDIQMPGINGIETMKEIRKSNPNTIFIVVSAYDKFDYAREAMSIGAMDYVNKPIDQKVIADILRKAMARVDAGKEKRNNDLRVKEKLEIVVPIIESGFIYSVLFQDNYADGTENFKTLLGIEENYGYMMVIECGDSREGGKLTNMVGTSVRVKSYDRELREIIKNYFSCVVGNMMSNRIMALVPCKNVPEQADQEYAERIHIIESARKMARELNHRLDAQFRVGIGSVHRLAEASESYMEALNSMRETTGSVAHVKDLPIGCEYEDDYPVEIERALFDKTEKGDVNGAVAEAGSFFDWMTERYPESMMDIKLKTLEFVLWAEHISYQNGGRIYHFKSRHDYLQTIIDMDDYEKLKSWFLSKVREACVSVANKKEKCLL